MSILLAACSGPSGATTTIRPPTTSPPEATSTLPDVEVRIEDCDQPPVTFSALCETFALLDVWHVDQPVDAGLLAGAAQDALRQDLSGVDLAAPPRAIPCAVPDPAFFSFCRELAEVIAAQGLAVAPLMDRVVAAMIDEVYGPFTYYLAPDQVTAFRQNGLVGGVGLLLDATDSVGSKCARVGPTCPLRIVVVLDGNPGKAVGLTSGDVIVAVDGVPVDGQGFAATAAQISGDETGTVTLTVERDQDRIDFDIARSELVVPNVVVEVVSAGTAYLRIPDFESDVPDLVSDALAQLSGAWSTLVIDLRDNPGGLVDSAMAIATEFVPDGPIFHEVYGGDSETADSLGPGGLATTGRLVVLVNQGTASAAEMLAGALRDRRGATLIGAPTFGKDAIQIRFDLRNGGRLHVAVARWLTPAGSSAGNGGLVPDVELELTEDMTVSQLVETALEATP